MLRQIVQTLAVVAAMLQLSPTDASAASPNIVLIVADDNYGEAEAKQLDILNRMFFAMRLRFDIVIDCGQSTTIQ